MKLLRLLMIIAILMVGMSGTFAQEINPTDDAELAAALTEIVHPLDTVDPDYGAILDAIGDDPIVLIGEASHGTHEFYEIRAEISQQLIAEKGFNAVLVEGDFPATYDVNLYVRGLSDFENAEAAMQGFDRFPRWMWRNTVVLAFAEWLRDYNHDLADASQIVGFYGMDLYSLYPSIQGVIEYLQAVQPAAAERAIKRYQCFNGYVDDPFEYGLTAKMNTNYSCDEETSAQLAELVHNEDELLSDDILLDEAGYFYSRQNARVVDNAELYYRAAVGGVDVDSWNVRDTHMFETLEALQAYLIETQGYAKIIVWAHNSHLGNAAATDMGRQRGQFNIGQLVKEAYGDNATLIGMTTYTGTVTATDNWDLPGECKAVNPGTPGTYNHLFHETGIPRFVLFLDDENPLLDALSVERLERAIGVIYRPETERMSHYFYAELPQQFDMVIHVDTTTALQPLDQELDCPTP